MTRLWVRLRPMRGDRGDVEHALRRRPGHLPVDEPQELELGVHLGEVDLHPLLIDDARSVGLERRLRPVADLGVARSTTPLLQSVTRSRLSCVVISVHPPFSSPTRYLAGTRTSSKKTELMS